MHDPQVDNIPRRVHNHSGKEIERFPIKLVIHATFVILYDI